MRGCATVAVLAGLLATTPASEARADPQLSVYTTQGAAFQWPRAGPTQVAYDLGIRGDLLVLRRRDSDMAVGPYVGLSTTGLRAVALAGGVEWLAPVIEGAPFILGVGGFVRSAPGDGWSPGVAASLFWGSRSYNFHSIYGLTAGVFVEGRLGTGAVRERDVVAGVRVDLELLALPFILAYQALR